MDPEQVSPGRRFAQVGASVLWCLTTAGVVFGYAALKPVLVDSGVYSEFCDQGERYCKTSDTRMNFMFTLATVITNGCALPVGSVLDSIGPQKTTIIGATLFLCGNVLFGLQVVHGAVDTYLLGYALLALGSIAIFLSQFHLSNTFPQYSGVILAAITGAFDASSIPYLLYREAYFRLGKPSLQTFFWMYTLFPILIIIQQLLAGPQQIYNRNSVGSAISFNTDADDEDFDDLARVRSLPDTQRVPFRDDPVASGFSRISYPLVGTMMDGDQDEEEIKALSGPNDDGVVGAMFGKTLKEQVTSSWFWIISAYLFVAMVRTNWYLATVQSQLEYYTTAALANTLTKAFTVLLPVAGIIGIPFVGLLLDNRPTIEATFVLLVFGILFGALTLVHGTVPQLVGIGFLVFNRPLLYTFVSDIFAKVFGFANFGKVYGLAMTLSGIIGLILTPMDVLTKDYFGNNYNPVNVTLLGIGIITNVALTARIWMHVREGRINLGE